MSSVRLILLAGGSSSRFNPLKEKNLFKFLGKTIVRHQVEQFSRHGFEDITIVCSSENLPSIREEAALISKDVVILEQQGEGQAGAVLTALESFPASSPLLIVNMNDIFDESLFEKFNSHVQRFADENVLVGFHVSDYFPGGYLVLEGDFVVDVLEKPGEGNEPSQFVRLVFDYFSDSSRLHEALKQASSSKDDVYEVALANLMDEGQKFRMIKHDGTWKTIKYPWHVLSMMEYFLNSIEGISISETAQVSESAKIYGPVIIESGVKVMDNAVIRGPVYIGANTVIANASLVRNSMVGAQCVVGFATEIARSYIGDNCWFHTNYIGDSILGTNVSFGSGAVTANLRLDEQNIKMNIKGEAIDTGINKLGVVIGNNVRIGVNTSILPGIKIGQKTFVGTGVLVDSDIEDTKFVYVKQEKEIRDNRFDITTISREDLKKKI